MFVTFMFIGNSAPVQADWPLKPFRTYIRATELSVQRARSIVLLQVPMDQEVKSRPTPMSGVWAQLNFL